MSVKSKPYLWCFLIALLMRLLMIFLSHSKDHEIDLAIYRDAGQLVVNGINPYDFNDNKELRQKLRTDKDNFNEYVSSDQDRWDYYANSNLPLATLFFGCIEFCFASPRAFRYVFAFFDSILAAMILAFVINKWKYHLPDNKFVRSLPAKFRTDLPLYIGFSLGAISPELLIWGTFIPEPKGIGLLLILSSIYFSDSTNRKLSMLLSPVLLGFSVAFIGLGIFITPLCLYNIYKNNKNGFRNITVYCLISFISCAICLVPFMPELGIMMFNRINGAINAEPYHSSMWTELFKLLPKGWLLFREALIIFFVIINIIGFLRKRLSVSILSANLLYLFTCIYLLDGSLDRMNISIVTLILLVGFSRVFYITNILWLIYFIYGVFSFFYSYFFGIKQDVDGLFVFLFTVFYIALLLVQTFTKKTAAYEAINSNTGI